MTIRGVLLAGGRGERLGLDTVKALAVVGGVTLLERAIATLARVADEIAIAAPAALELPLPGARVPLRRVPDRAPGGCPLAGVVAGLEAGFDRAIVLGVDFPLIASATLAALLARLATAAGTLAVIPAPGGRLQPLAAVYAAQAGGRLTDAFDAGERSVVRAVERLAPLVLEDFDLAELPGGVENFFNLNTPEDLAATQRRFAAGASRP